MCGPLFAFWAGRHNNGPIKERPREVRGGNVNTRVVKLHPLNRDSHNEGAGKVVGENGGMREQRRDQRYETFPPPFGMERFEDHFAVEKSNGMWLTNDSDNVA
jgi:hypothetical protein